MGQDHIIDGLDGPFHYIEWGGEGPLAHFAHATGFCAGLYTPLAEKLKQRLQVVGMDDRGHGKTRAPANPRTLKNWDVFVDDLAHFFEHLGEPVIAMGHSRGGVASLLLAVKRPELVRALILVDPTILPFSWMWWWYLAKRTGFAKYVPIAHRAARRKNVWPDRETLLGAYRGKASFKAWKEGFLENYVACGTEKTGRGSIELCCEPAWESRCFAVCPDDVWRSVSKIHQPTLVLYGKNSDTFLPPAVKRLKVKVPHATIVGFKDTGHFVPMERPDACVEAIFSFLDDNQMI